MAKLLVRLRGKQISEVFLQSGQQYVAGRKEGCDIVLQGEKGISREHFKVHEVDGQWQLDVLSRFGEVYAGRERVENLLLEQGVVFSVPPYEFEFSLSQDAASPQGEKNFEQKELGPEEKTFVGVSKVVPYIKVVDKNHEPVELIRLEGGDAWVGGRDPSLPIVIRDPRVSRRQFEIRKLGSSYSIIDLGSVNGTLLNGNPVSTTDPVRLKSGDAITVLDNYLYFELHDPSFRQRVEMVPVQSPSPILQPLPVAHDVAPQGNNLSLETSGAGLPQEWSPLPQAGTPVVYDPTQYYGTHPDSSSAYSSQTSPMSQVALDERKKKLLIVAAVVIIVGIVVTSQSDSDMPARSSSVATSAKGPQSPFDALTDEQKLQVKNYFNLSKEFYHQGKYELAKEQLAKMKELIPEYEDSASLEMYIHQAIEVSRQQARLEELAAAKQEQEEKIQNQVKECRKLLKPDVTVDVIEECFAPVIAFNPEHPAILEIKSKAEAIVTERQLAEMRRAEYRSQVTRMRGIYESAEAIHRKKQWLNAIEAYEKVIATNLPDPDNLKGRARESIAQIRKFIASQTRNLREKAAARASAGDLKGSILLLREAMKIDPDNRELLEETNRQINDLRKQMRDIFQEGVLEESFGNVEGSDLRAGAKDKWRKILQLDIPDGEFYQKALIKLKKYGGP
ncbi:MAG: FHA domain-containing protein [Bdellovibrionaceae bacterium]|nr:FHA domain-containing protein [Pseudobdellovibrionaceae bacterium]